MADLQLEVFCQLIPAERDSHPPIELLDGEPLLIGRGPLTRITDKRVSRNHVKLTANFAAKELTVKQLGANLSRVGGKELAKNQSSVLGQMGVFELVPEKYRYHVHFGERVPESVLEELKQGADSNSVDEDEDTPVDKGGLKRKRNSSQRDGPVESEKLPSPKRSKSNKTASSEASRPQQTSLTAFYKHTSSEEDAKPLEPKWEEKGSLLILNFGEPINSHKIASYDLDGTLIETASGRKFATSASDWKIMTNYNVKNKLQSLHREGYKIVIISNQLGIAKGKPTKGDFKIKAESIARALNIPLLLLAASSRDMYRKPCTGMWDHMISSENGGVVVNMKESFYVGDAAGREANWKPGRKKDFSCTDRKFTANLGLTFLTPEEHFLKSSKCIKFSWGEFDPRALDYTTVGPKVEPSDAKFHSDSQEVVVFVGCPASGKSTFFTTHMKPKGYVHVNRDTLGTWQKCVAECAKCLSAGKSVVIDNTSPDKDSRLRYIDVARKHKVPVRCFQFMTTIAHAKHNNRFRELTVKSSKHVKVNDMVFNTYKSKFCEPELTEGFSEIVKIHFNPSFDNDLQANLYRRFLD